MIIKMSPETLAALQDALHTAREDAPPPPPVIDDIRKNGGLSMEILEVLANLSPVKDDAAGLLDAVRSVSLLSGGMEDEITTIANWEPETVQFLRRSACEMVAVALRLHSSIAAMIVNQATEDRRHA